jgi:TusA-related sulfurtransferase
MRIITIIATTTPTAANVPATAPLFAKNEVVVFEAASAVLVLVLLDVDDPLAVVITTTVET